MQKGFNLKNGQTLLILFLSLFSIAVFIFLFNFISGADYYRVGVNQEVTVDECSKCPNDPTCCRRVKNNCSGEIFIPTKTCEEWREFKIHVPTCASLNSCPTPTPTSGPEPPPESDPCEGVDCGPCQGASSVDDSECCSYEGQQCLHGWVVDVYICRLDWCCPIDGSCKHTTQMVTCQTGEQC